MDRLTIKELQEAIDNIDELVERQHTSREELDREEDWSPNDALDYDGYFVIPGVTFDYGDTSSGGVCINADPRDSKPVFRADLLRELQRLKVNKIKALSARKAQDYR